MQIGYGTYQNFILIAFTAAIVASYNIGYLIPSLASCRPLPLANSKKYKQAMV